MRLFVFVFLLVSFVALASAQQSNPLCPTITLTGPPGLTLPGDTMTFTVSVSSNSTTMKFDWTVSHGIIEAGQGTPTITVRTSRADEGTSIEASVSVKGLPMGCKDTASESAPVLPVIGCVSPSDEFGNLKPNDIRGRLDNFFTELTNNPTNDGLILLDVTEKESLDKKNARLQFIVRHAKFRKFDLERLIFKFEPSDELRTRFWRIPPGAETLCPECATIFGREFK